MPIAITRSSSTRLTWDRRPSSPARVTTSSPLLAVRKVMSANLLLLYPFLHEERRLTRGIGAPPLPGCPTPLGRIHYRGSCGLPRRRAALGAPLVRCLSTAWPSRSSRSGRPRTPQQVDLHPAENRLALAVGKPDRVRLPHRTLDHCSLGPTHRAGMGGVLQPALFGRLAALPGLVAAKAPARGAGKQLEGHRGLARNGVAAHQEKGAPARGFADPARRERPVDGTAGAAHLGLEGAHARGKGAQRPSGKGVGRGSLVAVAPPRPPRVVLPDLGERVFQ